MLESDLQCGSFNVGGLDGGRIGQDFAGLPVGEEDEAVVVRVQLQVQLEVDAADVSSKSNFGDPEENLNPLNK